MPKDKTDKAHPDTSSTTFDTQPRDGSIDPSAPTTGTEGWGQTSDERLVLSDNHPHHTRSGQMKGNPGDHMTTASQREEKKANSNKKPSDEPGENQPDLSRLTSGSAHSMHHSHPGENRTFRCADAGNADCQWETSGGSDNEIMQRAEEHSHEHHGMGDWTEAARDKVKNAIRRRKAA
jgi:predicted small metal-binding protein